MGEEYPVKRRFPRFAIQEGLDGRITAIHPATLKNISLGGALVEHAGVVRPGTLSHLMIPVKGQEITLACRVVRSKVVRAVQREDGERELIHQTGVEFLNLSKEAQKAIQELIASFQAGGGGSPSGLKLTWMLEG